MTHTSASTPATPFAKNDDKQLTALQQLSDIFNTTVEDKNLLLTDYKLTQPRVSKQQQPKIIPCQQTTTPCATQVTPTLITDNKGPIPRICDTHQSVGPRHPKQQQQSTALQPTIKPTSSSSLRSNYQQLIQQ